MMLAESGAFITSGMVQPIVDAVTDNATVLVPIGIGIMAVMVGISLIPRIVYKFL
jgi:hypothetical protein